MELRQFTYLFLIVVLLLLTLLAGPKKNARLRGIIKYMVPAVLFSVAIYIMWDNRFAEIGIWSFNPGFITGINLWGLPLEEWLFLIAVSFVSLIVYDRSKFNFSNIEKNNILLAVSLILLAVFVTTAFLSRQKLYPFFTFFLLSVYFGYTIFRNRFKKHYTTFYITYLIIIIPVFVIKVILTALPVISYNMSAIIGVHIFNVPVEDFGYFFLLILMNITIFEYLYERRFF